MKKIKNKQYGQAMAEFALTIPVFLLLIFGVIELSRFFLTYSSVFTASREATRFGSSVGDINNQNYLDCGAIAERAVFSGSFGGVQLNDITIAYESTPGTIVATCPDVNFGSTPIKVGCTSGDCEYEPELGHRILVDIVTDFDSLLGIVPDLPIKATNGRTIMQELKVYSDPVERIFCYDVVEFYDALVKVDGENTLLIHVINDSTVQHYIIYEIQNINWNQEAELPVLKEIKWNNNVIWVNYEPDQDPPTPIIYLEKTPPIDILWTEWDSEFSFSLPAKATEESEPIQVPLEFVFDPDGPEIVLSDLDFHFDLIVMHSGFSDDICNPVDFGD